MRDRDGNSDANLPSGSLSQQRWCMLASIMLAVPALELEVHARPASRLLRKLFFERGPKFSSQPLDNSDALSIARARVLPADIHRSGGQLLDNLGLTSRVRGGSLHVD
jgi:hypothetical protein